MNVPRIHWLDGRFARYRRQLQCRLVMSLAIGLALTAPSLSHADDPAILTPPVAFKKQTDIVPRYEHNRLATPTMLRIAQADEPANVAVHADLVYREVDNTKLMIDLVVPKGGNDARPTVLIFHGIGPMTKGRAGMRNYAVALAQRGFAVLVVGFRHESKHVYPAAFDDADAAVTWVHANAAKHGFDKDRVGVLGFSGGGGLAMILGTKKPDQVRAVVSYYGPSDMTLLHQKASDPTGVLLIRPLLKKWLTGTPQEVPLIYRDASPITFVQKHAAPHLFIHGTADEVVPLEQSKIMAKKLKSVGVKSRVLTLEDAPHNFETTPGLYAQVAFRATELFFAENLLPRRTASVGRLAESVTDPNPGMRKNIHE